MIIILVMMVVFSAMVLPAYPGMVHGAQARAATRALVGQLRAAREYAIVNQRAVALIFDEENRALIPQVEELPEVETGFAEEAPPDKLMPAVVLPEGYTLGMQRAEVDTLPALLAAEEPDAIVFEADGSCPDTEVVLEGPRTQPIYIHILSGGARIRVVEVEES